MAETLRRGNPPHPERDQVIARIMAGETTARAEADRLKLSYKTVQSWASEARRAQRRSARPPLERALEAAGEVAPLEAPDERQGELLTEPEVKLTADALVALSEVAVAIPVGIIGRSAGVEPADVERLSGFEKDEKAMLKALAPAAIPSLEASLSKWPHAGLAIYCVALGVVAWAHVAGVRQLAAKKAATEVDAGWKAKPESNGHAAPAPGPAAATLLPGATFVP